MTFLDRSPGAFIALATLVVYGVVSAEIWMCTVASTAAVAVTLALIAVCAVLICRAVVHLMDDDADEPRTTPAPVRQTAAPRATVARRPHRVVPTA